MQPDFFGFVLQVCSLACHVVICSLYLLLTDLQPVETWITSTHWVIASGRLIGYRSRTQGKVEKCDHVDFHSGVPFSRDMPCLAFWFFSRPRLQLNILAFTWFRTQRLAMHQTSQRTLLLSNKYCPLYARALPLDKLHIEAQPQAAY